MKNEGLCLPLESVLNPPVGVKQPLSVHTSGGHTLVLPNNSVVLQGNVSGAEPDSVSYLWIRDGQSPAAGVSRQPLSLGFLYLLVYF